MFAALPAIGRFLARAEYPTIPHELPDRELPPSRRHPVVGVDLLADSR